MFFPMRMTLIVIAAAIAAGAAPAAEEKQPAAPKPADRPDREALERKFEQTLTDAVLIGSFTMKGEKNAGKLHQERYVISKVQKMQGDFWLFNARITYGNHDATLPLLFEVRWAGDTPVITLDKAKIPGFGAFTARVLIFDNQYVGTWDGGGDHGGQLFGRIERNKPAEQPKSGK